MKFVTKDAIQESSPFYLKCQNMMRLIFGEGKQGLGSFSNEMCDRRQGKSNNFFKNKRLNTKLIWTF